MRKKLTVKRAGSLFRKYLEDSGYKEETIRGKMIYIRWFLDFLEKKESEMDLRDVNAKMIRKFLKFLSGTVSGRTKQPLARRTIQAIFSTVRLMFKCFYQLELILVNPARDISYKAQGETGRREILTSAEVGCFLDSIDTDEPAGLQDRCIFELMYSSGLRSSEVVNLRVGDIDFAGRMLLIREAKWGKDRVVPVNEVAMKFLMLHLGRRRYEKEGLVFPSKTGSRKGGVTLNRNFKDRLKKLEIYRQGMSAHSLRHSVAVHLLAEGADLRYVQELLGHDSIETTVGYTEELYENLLKIYRQYHPRENDFFREIDDEYMDRLDNFYAELRLQKTRSARQQAYKRKWERGWKNAGRKK